MLYYTFAFVSYGASLFLIQRRSSDRLAIFILGLLPIFVLVICRGSVGTDTAAYIQIVSEIQSSGASNLELGFVLLIKVMLLLGMEPKLILVALSFIITVVLIYGASFSYRALLITGFCIAPVFYLDMTMNGLRYGLAFAFALGATGLFYQKRFLLCVVFAICAVLFHLSGWLVFILMVVFSDNKEECKKWLIIAISLGVLILMLQNLDKIAYLLQLIWPQFFLQNDVGVDLDGKMSAYTNFPSPSLLSGLAPLTLSLIALVFIKKTDMGTDVVRTRRFYLLLFGILFTFLIAKFSYAGLRMQFLLLFFMLICLQFKPAFGTLIDSSRKRMVMPILVLIAILGMASFVKNALITEGRGPSPWLPYSVDPDLSDILGLHSLDMEQ